MKKKLLLILLAASLLSFTSCKELDGTDVDNPFVGGQEEEPCGSVDRCMPTPYVGIQTGVICEKVDICMGITPSDPQDVCMHTLPYQNGLEQFITTSAHNYSQLNTLYNQKKLNVDSRNWDECLAAIQGLTCDSAVFTNAFNVNEPNNFSNIHNILSATSACVNVYTPKAQ